MGQLVAFLLVSVAGASAAERESIKRCIAASSHGQELKDRSDLLGTRADFRACATDACPKAIRADCGRWLLEAEQAIPSVVLIVRQGSLDVTDVVLTLDGAAVPLDGRPLELNPGQHLLRAARGGVTVEQPLTAYVAEKNRLVILSWPPEGTPEAPATEPPPVTQTAAPKAATAAVIEPAPSRALGGPLVLAGVGLAGAATFLAVGAWGRSELNRLENSPCGLTRTCPSGITDGVKTKYVVADTGLVIGIAALAGAALWGLAGGGPRAVSIAVDGHGMSVAGRVSY